MRSSISNSLDRQTFDRSLPIVLYLANLELQLAGFSRNRPA
jgi:hypothetical protein